MWRLKDIKSVYVCFSLIYIITFGLSTPFWKTLIKFSFMSLEPLPLIFFLITNNILVFLGIKWNYQIVHCLLYKSHQGLSAHFPKDYSHILQQTEYVMLAMFLWGISLSKTVCLCFDFASSTSSLWPLKVETPQGSVLGLFLFLVFMYFLGDLMQSYSWTLECYMPPIRPHHNA